MLWIWYVTIAALLGAAGAYITWQQGNTPKPDCALCAVKTDGTVVQWNGRP